MNNSMSQSFSGDDPLSILEHNLARTLKPVLPNPDFVKKLGYRIMNPPTITVENRTGLKAFVLFASALFSGILLIWLLITLYRFFSGRGKSD
jgi:hypothetical protein